MVCEMNHSASKSFIQVPELVLEAAGNSNLAYKSPRQAIGSVRLGQADIEVDVSQRNS